MTKEEFDILLEPLENWLDQSSDDVDETEIQGYMQAQDEVQIILKIIKSRFKK